MNFEESRSSGVKMTTQGSGLLLGVDFVSQPWKVCPDCGQGPVVTEAIEAESTRLILDPFLQKREYETNFENFKSSGAYM